MRPFQELDDMAKRGIRDSLKTLQYGLTAVEIECILKYLGDQETFTEYYSSGVAALTRVNPKVFGPPISLAQGHKFSVYWLVTELVKDNAKIVFTRNDRYGQVPTGSMRPVELPIGAVVYSYPVLLLIDAGTARLQMSNLVAPKILTISVSSKLRAKILKSDFKVVLDLGTRMTVELERGRPAFTSWELDWLNSNIKPGKLQREAYLAEVMGGLCSYKIVKPPKAEFDHDEWGQVFDTVLKRVDTINIQRTGNHWVPYSESAGTFKGPFGAVYSVG